METEVLVLAAGGLLLFYAAPAVVLYRGATGMSVLGRAILAIVVPPVFVFLMLINITLSAKYLPFLFDSLGDGRRGGLIHFIIACPIAVIVTYVIYRILKLMFPGKSVQTV